MIGISLGLVARLNGGASGPRIVLSGASVDENAANGTSVATASINGTVTGTAAWSLTDASGTFQINSSTGAITVLSNTALDYETNTSLPITISVSGVTPAVNDRGQSIAINNVIETPVNTVAPVISGGTVEGDTLTVTSNGTWTDMGAGSFSYQWNNGSNIAGATSSAYTLQASDVGLNVKCIFTATNAIGNASHDSNSVGPVSAAMSAPVNTVAPAITGTANSGQTLSVSNGTWTGNPSPTFTYQWKADDVAIGGATSNTFTLTDTQIGANITCDVTGTNTQGNATATSNSVGPVGAASSYVPTFYFLGF